MDGSLPALERFVKGQKTSDENSRKAVMSLNHKYGLFMADPIV